MTWQVRAATVDDAAAIVHINVRGWRHAYVDLIPAAVLAAMEIEPRIERLRERWRTTRLTGTLVVTDDAGTVLGYGAHGDYRPDDDAPSPGEGFGEVYAIYVDPDVIGSGAGSAVMRAMLEAEGDRPVALWVLEGNAVARRFYERWGFAPDGTRADFDASGTPVPEVRYQRPGAASSV